MMMNFTLIDDDEQNIDMSRTFENMDFIASYYRKKNRYISAFKTYYLQTIIYESGGGGGT